LIEITRSLVRTFRAVLKKIATVGGTREPPTLVVFRTDRTGLHVQARNTRIALEYCQPGTYSTDEIAVPAEALAEFEARKDMPLRMEANLSGVVATWLEKAVPQIRQYAAVEADKMPQMPAFPTRMDRQPVELLGALRDASETAGTDVTRYAVNCLQLCGNTGRVVGTDGRQMLAQSGYTFAWDDAVLIPASPMFGCRELYGQEPIAIGRTDQCLTLTIGPWSLHLTIDKNGRFPNVDHVLGGSGDARTVLQFDSGDAEFLLGNLDSLPGAKDDCSPVTIEGNGRVIVRAQGTEQPTPTEVVLARSSAQGPSISFSSDRHYLAHALRLGFRRIGVMAAGQPVLCREDKRQFMWMILGKDGVLKASEKATRLCSTDATAAAAPASPSGHGTATAATGKSDTTASKRPRVKDKPPAHATAPPTAAANGSDRVGIAIVLAEAEAIKQLLHQAFSRTQQLVAGVKRYRRQAQAVHSALGSLRHLQEVVN
jgi:hypothetical protein